jgi:hypothetical protein
MTKKIIYFIIGIILFWLANHLYGEWQWFIKNYEGISGLLIIVISITIIGIGFVIAALSSLKE